MPKEDTTSPTVLTESTFIKATIAPSEKRKVRCYNISSTLINTDVDKDGCMVQKGDVADMMVQIAPEVYMK
jgi:hypothetical protein